MGSLWMGCGGNAALGSFLGAAVDRRLGVIRVCWLGIIKLGIGIWCIGLLWELLLQAGTKAQMMSVECAAAKKGFTFAFAHDTVGLGLGLSFPRSSQGFRRYFWSTGTQPQVWRSAFPLQR